MKGLIMARQYRIRVYGKQRKDIDLALLAQVVILLGRQLQQQRQRQDSRTMKAARYPSASLHRRKLGLMKPSPQGTSHTPHNDGGHGGVG
jgi:hypothetical protein